MKQNTHSTKRLELRPFRASDYRRWYESYVECGPALNRWDHGPYPIHKSQRTHYAQLLKRLRDLAKTDEYYRYGAFEKKSGALVGHVDFDIYKRSHLQYSNFGYMIHGQFWGVGFGQEVAAQGLTIGFRDLKLHRLEASIDLENRKSIRVAKSIGMKREGIKKAYWLENGKWTDQVIYVARPEDFGFKHLTKDPKQY